MKQMTDLQAINRMLLGVKRLPLETLDTLGTNVEASLAKEILDTTTLEVLSAGLSFNTRVLTLSPDTNGHIALPADTLDVQDSTDPATIPKAYIGKAGRLYDIDESTDEFTESVELIIVMGFDFNDLPFVVQSVILHESRKSFAIEMKGKALTTGDHRDFDRHIAKSRGIMSGWDLRQSRPKLIGSQTGLLFQSRNTPRRGY